jgi:carbamoyltransferase
MRYVGYSELFHDAGLAFVDKKGEIELAVHAERFSGLKFDPSLTQEMYDMIRDDDHVTFYEDHDIRNKSIYHKGAISEFGHDIWIDAMFRPVSNGSIQNLNNISSGLVYDDCITHHQSHAAMAYYTRPWESSEDTVTLTIDGMGEAQSVCIYDHNLKLLDYWNNPKSIGVYYTQTTKCTGYKSMEDEYVIMGLSAYGNNKWGDDFIKKFDALPPYDPDEPDIITRLMHESMHQYCIWIHEQIKKSSNEDAAASIQKFAEHFIIDRVIEARKHGKKLCYGGGVAQNVVANSMIKELGIFDDIWIAPSPTDAGSALGAAAHSYCTATGNTRINWNNSFLGTEIEGDPNPKAIVEYLLKHKVCGLATGKAEYGPRALGNRSLIADVRYDVKDTVNEIKRRQKFRPFAPAIMEEFVDDYFDGPTNEYMQYQAKALHDYKSVTHVDGTARVQVVKKDCGTVLRSVLEEYYEKTGVPMLLNTSLNIRGKPMVNTLTDARRWQAKYGVKVFS